MLFERWRRPRSPGDHFHDPWHAWWESTGRQEVIRLLHDHDCPTDPDFNGPHWSEAEGIDDMAFYGGADPESLQEVLIGGAEDIERGDPALRRDVAAANAIAQYLHDHAPTLTH